MEEKGCDVCESSSRPRADHNSRNPNQKSHTGNEEVRADPFPTHGPSLAGAGNIVTGVLKIKSNHGVRISTSSADKVVASLGS